MGCLFDILVEPILNFLTPKTPWAWFVRLGAVTAAIVVYLVAADAGVLPWQQ